MDKRLTSMKRTKQIKKVIYYTMATLLAVVMIYPLVWMLFSSFKQNDQIFVTATHLWPEKWDVVHNYSTGWKGIAGVGFGRFMWNSLVIAVIGTVTGLFSSVLAAYAFARLNFKGHKFFFACVMATMLIPNQVMIVPQYIIFRNLNLLDKTISMIIPWMFGGAFFIFLFVQFIRGLPIELEEAAAIDGCGKFRILFNIIIPNIVPAIITGAIFSFYWIWQDFFQPLIFMNTPEKFPVSLGLRLYLDPESACEYGSMLSMAVVSVIPVLLIFTFFQKYLVEGTATSGLKG